MKELATTILIGMFFGVVLSLSAGMLLVVGHKVKKVLAGSKNKE